LGYPSNYCANSASVSSPRTAANATLALKAGLCFRLGLFVIVSADRSHPVRHQADNPLSSLCRLAQPFLKQAGELNA
jgi:hypothetical protein